MVSADVKAASGVLGWTPAAREAPAGAREISRSPEEKLRGEASSEIEVPGAQKPESVEVRNEINPNTE
jgi:hypothetical protein